MVILEAKEGRRVRTARTRFFDALLIYLAFNKRTCFHFCVLGGPALASCPGQEAASGENRGHIIGRYKWQQ